MAMNNDASNEVMSIDSNDTDPPNDNLLEEQDKPLMKLFKRLIGNDTKENTVLTNAQIIDILQKEFEMEISYIHELEIEIYLNLMKKFLKDWPQWDEFDLAIQKLKNKKAQAAIKYMLQVNYENIKEYLKKMLLAAAPPLKKAIDEVKVASGEAEKLTKNDTKVDSVLLEINCTRLQLNQFFYRRPHPEKGNVIFNIDAIPKRITIQAFSLESILNWPNIKININGYITMRRDSIHTLKHVLVNKKNNCELAGPVELNTNIQLKEVKRCSESYKLTVFERLKLILGGAQNEELKTLFLAICNIIYKDLQNFTLKLKMPTTYRKTLNKYPYVRYLYSDVISSEQCHANRYDLQLEETMIPQIFLRFTSVNYYYEGLPADGSWLKIECASCKTSFSGINIVFELKQHFVEYHQDEPDWQCTKCKKMFPVVTLSENNWYHDCGTD